MTFQMPQQPHFVHGQFACTVPLVSAYGNARWRLDNIDLYLQFPSFSATSSWAAYNLLSACTACQGLDDSVPKYAYLLNPLNASLRIVYITAGMHLFRAALPGSYLITRT